MPNKNPSHLSPLRIGTRVTTHDGSLATVIAPAPHDSYSVRTDDDGRDWIYQRSQLTEVCS